jgi:hypothetical protein
MEEKNMMFGYIAYGTMTQELSQLTPEKRKKEMERVKEEAIKHGFDVIYWGHPYGLTENIVVVFKSEKTLDAYHNLNINLPLTDTRTNIIVIP